MRFALKPFVIHIHKSTPVCGCSTIRTKPAHIHILCVGNSLSTTSAICICAVDHLSILVQWSLAKYDLPHSANPARTMRCYTANGAISRSVSTQNMLVNSFDCGRNGRIQVYVLSSAETGQLWEPIVGWMDTLRDQ